MFGGSGAFGGGGGYGDGMGGGGGGFQGGFSSPGAGGDKTRKFRSQNIAPLSTADIATLTHDGNGFFLDDLEVGQVTILGIITHADKSQTSVTYTIDDATAAPVSLKHWYAIEGGEEAEGEEQITYSEGTYVRVYAQIRSFQNKISLSALKIKPIEDMNELTSHILECIKFRMTLSKKKKSGGDFGGGMNMGGGFKQESAGSSVTNMGIDRVQSQVFDMIKDCMDETGVSVNDLKQNLKGLNLTQIKNALEFLSNEGHIYTTIDDEHFKSTG